MEATAAVATRRMWHRGSLVRSPLAAWRARLDAALWRALAMQLVAAPHGLGGQPARRPGPAQPRGTMQESCPVTVEDPRHRCDRNQQPPDLWLFPQLARAEEREIHQRRARSGMRGSARCGQSGSREVGAVSQSARTPSMP